MQIKTEHGKLLVTEANRIVCPVCGKLTPVRLLDTTQLTDFPLFCKNCKTTTIVNTEPEPLSLSR